MKTQNTIFFAIIFLLCSCNAYNDIPVYQLTTGMSVSKVQSIVRQSMVKVSMSKENGIEKTVYQVQKRIVRGGIARQERYNLYFIDGELLKYEKESENFSF